MKILLLFLFTIAVNAQSSGIVKDSLTGVPIPYVNIWVENENIGTNSEPDGTFSLKTKPNARLVFSALGYESRTVNAEKSNTILMVSKVYQMKEVVVSNPKESKSTKLGRAHQKYYKRSFQNTSQIYGKVFDVQNELAKTPFLSEIQIFTHSNIDSARFGLRIMDLDEYGFPKNDLSTKEIIVFVKKGFRKTKVDVSKHQIYLTDNKIFVGFQSLIINENKYKFDVDKNIKLRQKAHQHEPSLIINPIDEVLVFHSFKLDIWTQAKPTPEGNFKGKIASPAINIVLSN